MKYRKINPYGYQPKPIRFWKDLWGYQKKIVGRLDNLFDDIGDSCLKYYDVFFTRYRPSLFPELDKQYINVKEAWGSVNALPWDVNFSGESYRANLRRYKCAESRGLDDVAIENFYGYHNDCTLYSSYIYFKSMFSFNEIISIFFIVLFIFYIIKYIVEIVPKFLHSFLAWWSFFLVLLSSYFVNVKDLIINIDYLFILSYSFLEFEECYYQYLFKPLLILAIHWNESHITDIYRIEIKNQQYHSLLDYVEARERIRRVEFRKETFSKYLFNDSLFMFNMLKFSKDQNFYNYIEKGYSNSKLPRARHKMSEFNNFSFMSPKSIQELGILKSYNVYRGLLNNYRIKNNLYSRGLGGIWLKFIKFSEKFVLKKKKD